jgi:hypothetical protein
LTKAIFTLPFVGKNFFRGIVLNSELPFGKDKPTHCSAVFMIASKKAVLFFRRRHLTASVDRSPVLHSRRTKAWWAQAVALSMKIRLPGLWPMGKSGNCQQAQSMLGLSILGLPMLLRLGDIMAKGIVSAKIARPRLSLVIERGSLFGLLDNSLLNPVIWVASPAGSGKTTLVSSYLDSRKIPCLWYKCDEGDADPATFFYYMGIALKRARPRKRVELPLLTPEYRTAIPAFAKRYFEKLYSLLLSTQKSKSEPNRCCIILDNYQDVREESPFHAIMANGFDVIPQGVHIIVISRSDPPAALARLQANGKISRLEYGDLRFTLEESKMLVHSRVPQLNCESISAIHRNTRGWAAGIILMLERARLEGGFAESSDDFAYEGVFDYFAGEIFNRTPEEVQEFLLNTAFLPVLSINLIKALTGIKQAGLILLSLRSQNFFTERLSGRINCLSPALLRSAELSAYQNLSGITETELYTILSGLLTAAP